MRAWRWRYTPAEGRAAQPPLSTGGEGRRAQPDGQQGRMGKGSSTACFQNGAVRPDQALEETFLIARLAVALYFYLGLVLCGLIRRWRRPS